MEKSKAMKSKKKPRFFTIDTTPDVNEDAPVPVPPKKKRDKSQIYQQRANRRRQKQNKEDNERKERELTDALFGENSTLEGDLNVDTTDLNGDKDYSYTNPFETESEERAEIDEEGDDEEGEEEEEGLDSDSSKRKRKAVWEDDDDTNTRVKDVAASFSKARGSRGIRETSDAKYNQTLKDKFNEVYGDTPEWAQLDRKVEEEEDQEMRARTSVYLSSSAGSFLPKTLLSFKMVAHLNKGSLREGNVIKAVDFNADLNIALVAGYSGNKFGALTLFKFDGKKNLKLKNLLFPKFPVKCAKFLPKKSQLVVSSNLYGRFYVYDIQEGRKYDIPWQHSNSRNSLKHFEVCPSGEYIAFLGTDGEVNFYETKTMSLAESLRVPCKVNGIAFSPDGNLLYTCGDNGQVYLFDLLTWECRHSFYDEGCVEGTSIATSPNGRFLACGSSSGIVNLYDVASVTSSENPLPLKAFESLVTPVTSVAFNATSEVLASASSYKDNAFKLIHTRSLTYFANFPGVRDFKKIETVSFSPDSKFLSAGSNQGVAHLCRLFFY